MTEDLGEVSEISFVLNVDKSDSRLESMKRGYEGLLTVGIDGDETEYFVRVKSRYTLRDGSIRYRCIPLNK